ncbi:flavin-containing monooxygenase [Nitriliruptor alkaliphilus]|uniref:flavin-containing monooxygenase n=1 Tax=Nitriliruptor alkaliphilus TaxID=427918 RepID=UPI0006985AF1|nr:NAD(P)-binding domain-containing protein [Nitriliruptor alkaliphilus]
MAARTVCVVGGGVAGIAAAKALRERGIAFDAFEKSDRLGGVWSFGNPYGVSAAYDTLCLNSSRKMTEWPDLPMPSHYPDYPSHVQMEDYFNLYADRFGLREHYTFETSVARAERLPEGGWEVELSTGERRRYTTLLAANGHHHEPNVPSFPGQFDGEVIHAHDYTERESLRDRDVVVLGMGNSAMDIVAEAAKVGRSATLSARRGTYILPKYLFGRPIDHLPNDPRVPWAIRQRGLDLLIKRGHGRMADWGLPTPDHPLGGSHPTVSAEIFGQLERGAVTVKPCIAAYDGEKVEFTDGSKVRADLVVLATGYRITFPFLDPSILSAPDNDIRLFLNIFDPRWDDLAVMGLVQTVGSNIRMAHAQAQLVGDWVAGRYRLPPASEMRRAVDANTRAIQERYVASPRHTLQIDHHEYLRRIEREREAGAERAGIALPPPSGLRGVLASVRGRVG